MDKPYLKQLKRQHNVKNIKLISGNKFGNGNMHQYDDFSIEKSRPFDKKILLSMAFASRHWINMLVKTDLMQE